MPARRPHPTLQAGSHFDEDTSHGLPGGKAVEFSKLPGSEEEAGGSAAAALAAAAKEAGPL